ncbi:kinase-like protein [Xylariaceae sp. AK1471]|nr:kinase-like protein [Xylariaceae sp. AK1471]
MLPEIKTMACESQPDDLILLEGLPELVRDSRLQFTVNGPLHPSIGVRLARHHKETWIDHKPLRGGGFGTVYVQRKASSAAGTAELRAVKRIPILHHDVRSTRAYVRELEALAKFSQFKYSESELFIKFYGWYTSYEHLYIAMEYCGLGDLRSYLFDKQKCLQQRLPENAVRDIASQVIDALAFMHQERFAHRDLKPANILIMSQPPDKWAVKLCDLGLSKRVGETRGYSTEVKGTLDFMPPEVWSDNANEVNVDHFAADIWSLGETVFQALTGQTSMTLHERLRYYEGDSSFPKSPLHDLAITPVAIEFLQLVMAPNPAKRATANKAQTHMWIETGRPEYEVVPLSPSSDIESNTVPLSRAPQENSKSLSSEASGTWSNTNPAQSGAPVEFGYREEFDMLPARRAVARSLLEKQNYSAAEVEYREVSKLETKLLGPRDKDTLNTMDNLAITLNGQKKYEEAETLLRQTLSRREVLGRRESSDRATLSTMHLLTNILAEQKNYEEAEALGRKTLLFREKVLGWSHEASLSTMHLLAYILTEQKKYKESETLARTSFALSKEWLGFKQESTNISLGTVLYVLDAQGKYHEASRMRRKYEIQCQKWEKRRQGENESCGCRLM